MGNADGLRQQNARRHRAAMKQIYLVKGEFSWTVYLQQNVNGNVEPGRAGEETHTGSALDLVLFAKTARRKRTRRGDPKKQRGEILGRKQNPVLSPAKIIHRLQQ